jgi:hypothetical protein
LIPADQTRGGIFAKMPPLILCYIQKPFGIIYKRFSDASFETPKIEKRD